MDDCVVGVRRPSAEAVSPSPAVLRPPLGGTEDAVSIDVRSGCEQRAVRKIDRDHDVGCVQLGGDPPAHFDHRRGQPDELPGCGRIELQPERFPIVRLGERGRRVDLRRQEQDGDESRSPHAPRSKRPAKRALRRDDILHECNPQITTSGGANEGR